MHGHHGRRHHGFFDHIWHQFDRKNHRPEQRSGNAEGHCASRTALVIDSSRCTGCGSCKRACPSGAIKGGRKEPHWIDARKCTGCGICYKNCKSGAIFSQASQEETAKRNILP